MTSTSPSPPGGLPGCGAAEPQADGFVFGHEEAWRGPPAAGRGGEPPEATARIFGKGNRKAIYTTEPSRTLAEVKLFVCFMTSFLEYRVISKRNCGKKYAFTLNFLYNISLW